MYLLRFPHHRIVCLILLALGGLVCQRRALAVSASPAVITFVQPDGTTFKGHSQGDEYFHWFETLDGRPVIQDPNSKIWYYGVPDVAPGVQVIQGVTPLNGVKSNAVVGKDQPPAAAWTPVETADATAARNQPVIATVPVKPVGGGTVLDAHTKAVTNAKIAIFLGTFKDTSTSQIYSPDTFEKVFFSTDPDPAVHSITKFYNNMSYGTFNVTSGPAGINGGQTSWWVAPKNHDYYGQNTLDSKGNPIAGSDANPQEFVTSIIAGADTNFDFGPYDTDNDGYVDLVAVIYQGTGEADSSNASDIWPHRGNLSGNGYLTNDTNALGNPVRVKAYFVTNEIDTTSTKTPKEPCTMGTFAHEFGHGIGLPDLYDQSKGSVNNGGQGVGRFSLMGSGNYCVNPANNRQGDTPAWMDPWCRIKLGWTVPQSLAGNLSNVSIPDVKDQNVVYKLSKNGLGGPEYFLIENRQAKGDDAGLPDAGLTIYHVDDNINPGNNTDNVNQWWYISPTDQNTSNGHYRVALQQADGKFELEKGSSVGGAGDLYGAGKSFTASTIPSSNAYDGSATYVQVKNISAKQDVMTADFFVTQDASFPDVAVTDPHDDTLYNVVNTFSGTASATSGVKSVKVVLSEDVPGGRWWNWSGNAWGSTTFDGVTNVTTATGTTSWTKTIPNLPDGAYFVQAKSIDNNNSESNYKGVHFRVQADTGLPSITITSPQSGQMYSSAPTATGTATDNIGVAFKRLALYSNALGLWYNWNTSNFDLSTFDFSKHALQLNGAASPWSQALPPLNYGNYTLSAQSVDTSNQGSLWAQVGFTIGGAPLVAITTPTMKANLAHFPAVVGTAQDQSGTGIQNSRVNLTITSDQGYWNGSGWSSTSTAVHATISSSGDWAYPATSLDAQATLPTGSGTFTISASVTDNAGHKSSPISGYQANGNQLIISVDGTPPNCAILSPAANSTFTTVPSPGWFTGTASDSSGQPNVYLYLRRDSDYTYWNGSSWQGPPEGAAFWAVYVQGGGDIGSSTNWVMAGTMPTLGHGPNQMNNGAYEVIAIAVDSAGNQTQASLPFNVDYYPVYRWTGATMRDSNPNNDSNSWNVAANWVLEDEFTSSVPGPGDVAIIDNGDSVDCPTAMTLYGLRMIYGTVTFHGDLTTTGKSTWSAGYINTGTWTHQAGAVLTLDTSGVKDMPNHMTINNSGTIRWTGSGGYLRGTGGDCTVNNLAGATFELAADGSPFEDYYGNNVFNNYGTFTRTGGTDPVSLHSWTFNNYATIKCDASMLRFDGSLNLHAGTVFGGASAIQFNGTITADATFAIPSNVVMIGGVLNCTNATINGGMDWVMGTINGTLNIPAGSSLNLVPGGIKDMGNHMVINNSGTIKWTGGAGSYLRGTGGDCTVNNLAGGVYDCACDGSPFEDYYGNNIFNNAGTFIRSAGTDPSSVHSWTFNNTGTIKCTAGELHFDGLLNLNDGSIFAGTAPIMLNGTTNANATVSIPPTVSLIGGTLNCLNSISLGGNFYWDGGTLNGTLNIPSGSTLTLRSPVIKDMANHTVINNSGTILWTAGASGYLRGTGGDCTVNNLVGGVYNCACDGNPFEDYYGNNTFNNAGLFVRSAGTDPSSVHSWLFNNTGEIKCTAGSLQFDSTLNINAGSTFTGTAPIKFNGTINANASFTIQTSLAMIGGTLNCPSINNGISYTGTFNWSAGQLSGILNVPSSSKLNLIDASIKDMANHTVINNSGTIKWTGGDGGYLRGTGGDCVINNLASGTYDVAADGAPFENYYGNNVFNNSGTFVRSAGTLTTSLHAWTFNNAGTIRSSVATLQFDTDLNLNPGTVFAGLGQTNLNGNTHLNAGTTAALQNPVVIVGGTLTGDATASFTGTLEWDTGFLAGTLNIPADSVLNLATATPKYLANATVINNSGTVNWTGGSGGYLQANGGDCTFNNLAGGTFNIQADGSPFEIYYGNNVFNNAGNLMKTGGTGTSSLHAWIFNNTYKIISNSGSLVFDGGELHLNNGGLVMGTSAVHFSGGTSVFLKGTTQGLGGHGIFDGAGVTGDADGSGTLTGGRWDWESSTWRGIINVGVNCGLYFTGTSDHYLDYNASLENFGSIINEGTGSLLGYGNVILHNHTIGLFTGMPLSLTSYGGGNSFINDGALTIGAPLGSLAMDWAFTQTATGALNLEMAGLTPVTQFDQLSTGAATLDGKLNIGFRNGFTPAVNNTFLVMSFTSVTGTFASISSPGVVLDPTYNAGDLTLKCSSLTAPVITAQPLSQIAKIGDPVTFSVATSGTVTSYQWLKNNVAITVNGKASSYSIPAAALTNAAAYSVKVTNSIGTTTSIPAKLAVIGLPAAAVTVNQDGTITNTLSTAGPVTTPATVLHYQWMQDGHSVANGANPANSAGAITGATTTKLTITKAGALNTGAYTCMVSMDDPLNPGTPLSFTSGAFNVAVRLRPVMDPYTPGNWIVAGTVTENVTAQNSPTSFTALGLPPGLLINSAGRISGQIHSIITKPTIYPLTITATNAAGTSAPLKVNATVNPLPVNAFGTYNGLVDVDNVLTGGFGGTISLTATSTGSLSGKLTLGNLSYPFSNKQLDASAADGSASALITALRKLPLSNLTIIIHIDPFTGELTGHVSDGVATLNFQAWRNPWNATTNKAPLITCNTALQADAAIIGTGSNAANMQYPQGCGYGSLAITTAGTVTWTGKGADGVGLSCTTTMGPAGQIPIHQQLYANGVGAMHGWATVSADSPTLPVNNHLHLADGSVIWLKNAQTTGTTTDRMYKTGFPVHTLTLVGGEYVKPATGKVVLGLTDLGVGKNDARLTFSEGGLIGPAAAPWSIVPAVNATAPNKLFRIVATTQATVMPAGVVLNPAGLTCVVTGTSGAFTGTFTLKGDPDPTDHVAPIALLSRVVTYNGMIIPRLKYNNLDYNKGVGWFLLPKLPEDGPPKTTLLTSKEYSGLVILDGAPQ